MQNLFCRKHSNCIALWAKFTPGRLCCTDLPSNGKHWVAKQVACLLAEGSICGVLDFVDLLFHGCHLLLPLGNGGSQLSQAGVPLLRLTLQGSNLQTQCQQVKVVCEFTECKPCRPGRAL